MPIVAAVCGELRKRSLVAEERPTQLTPAGRELFAGGGLRIGRTAACPGCGGRGIVVPPGLSPLVRELSQRRPRRAARPARARPVPLHGRHEAPSPPRGPRGRCPRRPPRAPARRRRPDRARASAPRARPRLAFDDREPRGRGRRSQRSSPFSSASSPERRSRPTCVEHDLRRPLPPELSGAFDTVVTDPPYTTAGASLFLSRAAEALDDRGGDVFLSFGSRRPGRGGAASARDRRDRLRDPEHLAGLQRVRRRRRPRRHEPPLPPGRDRTSSRAPCRDRSPAPLYTAD